MEKQRRDGSSQVFHQNLNEGCLAQAKLAGPFCLQKEVSTTQYIICQVNGTFND